MFSWLKKKKPPIEGRMYDLRNSFWGHAIQFHGDGKQPRTHEVSGHLSPSVSNGDTFLYPTTKGLAVWLLTKVKKCSDPKDLFFAEAGPIRYATDEDLSQVDGSKETTGCRFV